MTPDMRMLIAGIVLALLLLAALQRKLFNPIWPNRRTLIVAIVLTLLLLAALPIWHRHGDIGGRMHGHAIWAGRHAH